MYCHHCGKKVMRDSNFCIGCGSQLLKEQLGSEGISPSQGGQAASVQIVKKKPMPFWFKLISFLAVIALIGVTAGILFTESLVDVVDSQLTSLRQKDVTKGYYAYTSKSFQKATSLEQFHDFLKAYPMFIDNQSAHFTQRSIDKNLGTLKGQLTSQGHVNTPVEYKLVKEDGKWKISSIRLIQPDSRSQVVSAPIQDLIDVVKAQLRALENKNVSVAYRKYGSKEFKEATSLEAFQDFVKKYPILSKHHAVSFQKPITKEGTSTVSAIVESGTFAAYVKYYLVYEDNAWKIWSMRILSPSYDEDRAQEPKAYLASPMRFSDVKLGSEVDDKGVITRAVQSFSPQSGAIFVNVDIVNGTPGSSILLDFKHVDSGSSIPAKAIIEESGDTTLMSSFSPPIEGWPAGSYKLTVTSSTGLRQFLEFEIQ